MNYLDELADGTLIVLDPIGKPFDNNPHLNYLILRIDKDGKTISSKRVFRSYDGGPQNCVGIGWKFIFVLQIFRGTNSYINGYLTKFSPKMVIAFGLENFHIEMIEMRVFTILASIGRWLLSHWPELDLR